MRIFERIAPTAEQEYGARAQKEAEAVLLGRKEELRCTRGVLPLCGVDVEHRRQPPDFRRRPACGKERVGGGKRLAKVPGGEKTFEREGETCAVLG